VSKPRVGVTTSLGRGRWLWWFMRLALWRVGIEPVRLFAGRDYPIARLDGLIVGGGDDISPTLYEGELDPAVRVDPARDALELRVLGHAFAEDLPVLGICRGAQMINTVLGGTLHEDIHEVYAEAPRLRTVLPKKTVTVVAGSELHRVLGQERCRVNALHHQSVDRLGDGLEVVAHDEHGMVQAIERPGGPYLIGVQWHPEFLVFDGGQQRLFGRLVHAAKARQRARRKALAA
jgi:putative glutamine amidotransferase